MVGFFPSSKQLGCLSRFGFGFGFGFGRGGRPDAGSAWLLLAARGMSSYLGAASRTRTWRSKQLLGASCVWRHYSKIRWKTILRYHELSLMGNVSTSDWPRTLRDCVVGYKHDDGKCFYLFYLFIYLFFLKGGFGRGASYSVLMPS